MRWVDVQSLGLGLASLNAYVNGPTYTAKGLELQLLARVTERLTLQGASSAGVTSVTPKNPTPVGQCITVVAGRPYAVGAEYLGAVLTTPRV